VDSPHWCCAWWQFYISAASNQSLRNDIGQNSL